jgi:hypothetical protein
MSEPTWGQPIPPDPRITEWVERRERMATAILAGMLAGECRTINPMAPEPYVAKAAVRWADVLLWALAEPVTPTEERS